MTYSSAGTSIDSNGSEDIELTSIDSFVASRKIEHIDFIKMDIEGSGKDALLGSKDVIIRDKPKLAISLYHRCDDFYKISDLILSFRSDYKLYMRHASDKLWETVLFAK
ncbi:FkbM family methyltransferase [Breznakiellaceae bacterium SP9]